MLTTALLVALFVGLVVAETDVADFDDHYRGYEIIFHDSRDLMIAIHGENCYFVSTPDGKESSLVDDPTAITSRLRHTEESLLSKIQHPDHSSVTPSTLEAVRNKYKDSLADFHCLDKHIFEVKLFSTQGSTPHTNTGAHVCTIGDLGRYPYPGDCHKFTVCINGIASTETCGAGTAFLDGNHPCMHSSQVPACRH